MPIKPSESEEEYFAREELERRKKWERERLEKMAEDERLRLKELHHMRCPKCGMELSHFEMNGIELDRCVTCGGTWFDDGEVDQLLAVERGVVEKFLSIFKG